MKRRLLAIDRELEHFLRVALPEDEDDVATTWNALVYRYALWDYESHEIELKLEAILEAQKNAKVILNDSE